MSDDEWVTIPGRTGWWERADGMDIMLADEDQEDDE